MRRFLHLLELGVLALALHGCPSTNTAGTSATDTGYGGVAEKSAGTFGAAVETQKFFPMQRTYTWTYDVVITTPAGTSSAVDTTQITSLTDSGSTKTAGYLATRKVAGEITAQDTGTLQQTAQQLTFTSSGGSEIISLPFRAGAEWTSGTFTARSYALPSVTAGGKTYKDVFAISYARDGEIRVVRYFAAYHGIVKQIAKSTVNGETVTTVSELKQARLSSVTAVSALPATVTLAVGATSSLNLLVSYDDGSADKDLLLTIASPSVATVTPAGLITAVSTGSTTLTARSNQDPTKAATVALTVN